MLTPEGAKIITLFPAEDQPPVFRRIAPPSSAQLQSLVQRIADRIGRALEREGLLIRDCETSYLTLDPTDGAPMNDLLGHSITYRVAVGPRAGEKVFALRTVPPVPEGEKADRVAQGSGFSLHAGVGTEGGERSQLEHLCRYIARSAVLTERLAVTGQGNIRYRLKTAYRDGTTHVVFEPLDFLARLAALVPLPRLLLEKFQGNFDAASYPSFSTEFAMNCHSHDALSLRPKPTWFRLIFLAQTAAHIFCDSDMFLRKSGGAV